MRMILIPLFAATTLVGCAQSKDPFASTSSSSSFDEAYAADDSANTYQASVLDVEPVETQATWSQPYVAPAASTSSDSQAAYPSAEHQVHVVQPKDTLYALARTYYEDSRAWKRIFKANRTQISHPDKIFVGMELIIP